MEREPEPVEPEQRSERLGERHARHLFDRHREQDIAAVVVLVVVAGHERRRAPARRSTPPSRAASSACADGRRRNPSTFVGGRAQAARVLEQLQERDLLAAGDAADDVQPRYESRREIPRDGVVEPQPASSARRRIAAAVNVFVLLAAGTWRPCHERRAAFASACRPRPSSGDRFGSRRRRARPASREPLEERLQVAVDRLRVETRSCPCPRRDEPRAEAADRMSRPRRAARSAASPGYRADARGPPARRPRHRP